VLADAEERSARCVASHGPQLVIAKSWLAAAQGLDRRALELFRGIQAVTTFPASRLSSRRPPVVRVTIFRCFSSVAVDSERQCKRCRTFTGARNLTTSRHLRVVTSTRWVRRFHGGSSEGCCRAVGARFRSPLSSSSVDWVGGLGDAAVVRRSACVVRRVGRRAYVGVGSLGGSGPLEFA
jgi:hypothetical protein